MFHAIIMNIQRKLSAAADYNAARLAALAAGDSGGGKIDIASATKRESKSVCSKNADFHTKQATDLVFT